MRLDKVDLNLFVVFDAIYRERSVTRVAAQLNLTQPAVSNALSRLRQTFDDPLFVRSPEGMAPTPVAEAMVGDVRRALELLGRSVGATARFDPAGSDRVFRLGMNDLAEALVLPPLHARLKGLAPGVSVTSYYVAREAATEELKAGLIDLLLEVPVINARDLHQQPQAEFDYRLAMRTGHPLAQGPVDLQSYLQAEHLHVSSRRRGRGHVDLALQRIGARRRVSMRVQNYLVAARITEQTDLLWTVPAVLARELPLHLVALPFAVEPLAWFLFWARSAEEDPANRWMRELIREVVADLGGINPPGAAPG